MLTFSGKKQMIVDACYDVILFSSISVSTDMTNQNFDD